MQTVFETIVTVPHGAEQQVAHLLEELGQSLAGATGLVDSYVLDGIDEASVAAHVSVWERREQAEGAFADALTAAVHAELQLHDPDLLEIVSERAAEALEPALA